MESVLQADPMCREIYLTKLASELNYDRLGIFMNPTKEVTANDAIEDMIGLFEAIKSGNGLVSIYQTKSNE